MWLPVSVISLVFLSLGIYLKYQQWGYLELILLAVIGLLLVGKYKYQYGCVAAIFLVVGGWLLSQAQANLQSYETTLQRAKMLVVAHPSFKANHQELTLKSVANKRLYLVKVPSYGDYRYGQILLVTGLATVPKNSDTFSYQLYLAGKGVSGVVAYPAAIEVSEEQSTWRYILGSWRVALDKILDEVYRDPEKTLVKGILIGMQEDLPGALQEQFKESGLLHIVVVSGYNMMLVVSALTLMLQSLSRRLKFSLAVLGVVLYGLLVGLSPPVLRAMVMAILVIVARIMGRPRDALNILALSAIILLLCNPFLLWSLSFQLSFAATSGLILLTEPISQVLVALRIKNMRLIDTLASPLAAVLSVLPILVNAMGELSLIFLPANMVASFLVPWLTGLSVLAVLTNILFGLVPMIIIYITAFPARMIIITAKLMSSFSFASVFVYAPPSWLWIFYYLALLIFATSFKRKELLDVNKEIFNEA